MNFRDAYLQAFREARADGRIGYRILNNPRARMAASEVLCLRMHGDLLDVFRYKFATSSAWERMADIHTRGSDRWAEVREQEHADHLWDQQHGTEE